MEQQYYTTTAASEITGCTPRQLQYWREKGLIVPTVNTKGAGRASYYTRADLLMLTIMKYLLSLGLTDSVCWETIRLIQEHRVEVVADDTSERQLPLFPLNAATGRYMVWLRPEPELMEYDDDKVRDAHAHGNLVIPLWLDTLQGRLDYDLEMYHEQQAQGTGMAADQASASLAG